ncbi:352aa long hypothetical protein [hydrothermal vent metagenome]|uniref:ATPase AAA-type core domain-containing protein n=1 Tax=hydrothermal vent metagenome TaxID=652676 RepID=A0A1W1BL91_9ZZZZ
MIEKIHIQNFKSIYDLELEVGRVNLFIGENGSGKSNLLEALVFVSASESNMLANEFLVSRGLRVPEPELMRSAFYEEDRNKDIKISIDCGTQEDIKEEYFFKNTNEAYSKWEVVIGSDKKISEYTDQLKQIPKEELFSSENHGVYKLVKLHLNDFYHKLELSINLNNFIIYSPENTALRIFEKEKQIQPLGINGEGLLKLLKVINNYEDKSYINTIIESLQLFNWFEDITIPTDISSMEDRVIIKDKYLYREFTQRSANEGFLFILFYITLIVAEETPKAFAIDNIDASLNPKLCTKLMTLLTELAKKYDKQIFLTTHNPAILDGIDLNDKEQKLFVVSRNKKGHTRMKEITVENKPKSSTNEPLKLSEAFLRGYLGGLPKGF